MSEHLLISFTKIYFYPINSNLCQYFVVELVQFTFQLPLESNEVKSVNCMNEQGPALLNKTGQMLGLLCRELALDPRGVESLEILQIASLRKPGKRQDSLFLIDTSSLFVSQILFSCGYFAARILQLTPEFRLDTLWQFVRVENIMFQSSDQCM